MDRNETLCERRGGEGARRISWLNELVVAVQEVLQDVFFDDRRRGIEQMERNVPVQPEE
jgi:hypothetical protein